MCNGVITRPIVVYYKFLKNFSEVTKQLQDIMKIGATKHGKVITKRTSKNVTVEWTIESNEAFEKLKIQY